MSGDNGAGVDDFMGLVEQLADLEQERTGTGGLSSDAAARRTRVERRLMGLLCAEIPADERRASLRVPTNMTVTVHMGPSAAQARMVDIGVGGAFIEGGLAATIGTDVVISVERPSGSLEHGFQLRAKVAWLGASDPRRRGGFGASFTSTTEADERRLRRLILQLLREHVPSSHD